MGGVGQSSKTQLGQAGQRAAEARGKDPGASLSNQQVLTPVEGLMDLSLISDFGEERGLGTDLSVGQLGPPRGYLLVKIQGPISGVQLS